MSLNFLLKTLEHREVEWYYFTSRDVDNVIGEQYKALLGKKYFVFPTQPDFRGSYWKVRTQIRDLEAKIRPDVVYSVTAPSYFSFSATEVMRFTNPWVTHPNKYSWKTLSGLSRLRMKLYCWNQRRLMRKTHWFITQTQTAASGIARVTGVSAEHIKVIGNVLPPIFKTLPKVADSEKDGWINVASIGNPVPHKNFDIIPSVLSELHKMGIDNVRFHTTIPEGHPLLEPLTSQLEAMAFSDRLVNHGRVSQKELSEIYDGCQMCFLPTLLEVFSASTLETMFYELPVVATDFGFNTDVFADSCLYYTPKDAHGAALKFKILMEDASLQTELKVKMRERLRLFDDYDKHFNAIQDFLCEVAKNY